jgi:hypothetical protein
MRAPNPAKTRQNCRLMVHFSGFRRPENWSKTHPRAREDPALSLKGRAAGAPFFCAQIPARER